MSATCKRQYQRSEDQDWREKLQARIGKLMGGSATLWVGGLSETEIDSRKSLAESTAAAMRAVAREGALPGGGMAYARCQDLLAPGRLNGGDADERAAFHILREALAEPARAIYENAGYEPGEIFARMAQAGSCQGFDVLSGQLVETNSLLDSAAVLKSALRNAVMTAGMALTIDVLVHHKTPEIARSPG